MSKITIRVPDGDKCANCDYISHSYYENAMRHSIDTYSCSIFKCEIKNGKKCIACKLCAMEDNTDD